MFSKTVICSNKSFRCLPLFLAPPSKFGLFMYYILLVCDIDFKSIFLLFFHLFSFSSVRHRQATAAGIARADTKASMWYSYTFPDELLKFSASAVPKLPKSIFFNRVICCSSSTAYIYPVLWSTSRRASLCPNWSSLRVSGADWSSLSCVLPRLITIPQTFVHIQHRMLYSQSLSTSHRSNHVSLWSIKNNNIKNTPSDTTCCRFWGILLLFIVLRYCDHDALQARPFLQKGVREPTNTETNVDIIGAILLQSLKNTEEILSWDILLNLKSDHSHGHSLITPASVGHSWMAWLATLAQFTKPVSYAPWEFSDTEMPKEVQTSTCGRLLCDYVPPDSCQFSNSQQQGAAGVSPLQQRPSPPPCKCSGLPQAPAWTLYSL